MDLWATGEERGNAAHLIQKASDSCSSQLSSTSWNNFTDVANISTVLIRDIDKAKFFKDLTTVGKLPRLVTKIKF